MTYKKTRHLLVIASLLAITVQFPVQAEKQHGKEKKTAKTDSRVPSTTTSKLRCVLIKNGETELAGTIIRTGFVLTLFRELNQRKEIIVNEKPAKLVAHDETENLALLACETKEAEYIRFGNGIDNQKIIASTPIYKKNPLIARGTLLVAKNGFSKRKEAISEKFFLSDIGWNMVLPGSAFYSKETEEFLGIEAGLDEQESMACGSSVSIKSEIIKIFLEKSLK